MNLWSILNKHKFTIVAILLLSGLAYYSYLFLEVNPFYIILVYSLTIWFLFNRKKETYFEAYLFIITIASGLWGFLRIEENFGDALYSTIKLFTVAVEPVHATAEINVMVMVAKWTAILFIIAAIVKNLYKLTNKKIRLFLYKFIGGHYVIHGNTDIAVYLTKDLLKQGKRVVFIGNSEPIQDIENNALIILDGNPLEFETLRRARLLSAAYFIVLTDNDSLNIDIMMKMKQFIHKGGLWSKRRKKCIVQITDSNMEKLFDDIEQSQFRNENIELQMFNSYQAIAKNLLMEHPLYTGKNVEVINKSSNPVHLVIIGFGKTGQHILLQVAKIGHFPNRRKVVVTIIDKEADKKLDQFRRRYKQIDKACTILAHHNVDIDSLDSIQLITDLNEKLPINYMAICLAENYSDFMKALLLFDDLNDANIFDIPLYIHKGQNGELASWIHHSNKYKNIHLFGDLQRIGTSEVIIGAKLDELAKNIYSIYTRDNKTTTPWEKLTSFEKYLNRAQADHMDTKLFALGLYKKQEDKITVKDKVITKEEFDKKLENHDLFEDLAAAEHERWSSIYYLNGWQGKAAIASEPRKDEAKKLHACLVPYEELATVSQVFQVDYQDNDKQVIRDLYDLLRENGYAVCEI